LLSNVASLSAGQSVRVVPFALTALAMIAFAANSLLCRLALGQGTIDAFSFTTIRLGTGALALSWLIRKRKRTASAADWSRAGLLILYALPFSLAYVGLDAGTGALLLFGAVQLTMIAVGIRNGERPSALEWLGLTGAAGGVVYLVFPGVSAPRPLHAGLMIAAGVGWGLYSIAGKKSDAPLVATAAAFQRAALVIVPVACVAWPWLSGSWWGALWAATSGALTSGLGYAIWYAALRDLTATRAALVQLSVPVLAAAGGIALLAEVITLRLAVASAVILGSIALGVTSRRRSP
jgi:drug/metabolite transporter (DMT)-like permease